MPALVTCSRALPPADQSQGVPCPRAGPRVQGRLPLRLCIRQLVQAGIGRARAGGRVDCRGRQGGLQAPQGQLRLRRRWRQHAVARGGEGVQRPAAAGASGGRTGSAACQTGRPCGGRGQGGGPGACCHPHALECPHTYQHKLPPPPPTLSHTPHTLPAHLRQAMGALQVAPSPSGGPTWRTSTQPVEPAPAALPPPGEPGAPSPPPPASPPRCPAPAAACTSST